MYCIDSTVLFLNCSKFVLWLFHFIAYTCGCVQFIQTLMEGVDIYSGSDLLQSKVTFYWNENTYLCQYGSKNLNTHVHSCPLKLCLNTTYDLLWRTHIHMHTSTWVPCSVSFTVVHRETSILFLLVMYPPPSCQVCLLLKCCQIHGGPTWDGGTLSDWKI